MPEKRSSFEVSVMSGRKFAALQGMVLWGQALKNSLSSVFIKKICIDIKIEQTEGSLPKHNVEKNATNIHN